MDRATHNRLVKSNRYDNCEFIELRLEDYDNLEKVVMVRKFDVVVNLASQVDARIP